jgi:signal recognition particle GTPase
MPYTAHISAHILRDMMGGDSSIESNVPQVTPAATLATGTAEEPAVILLAGLQGAGTCTGL